MKTTKPRPKSKKWEVGDLVLIGSERWVIRTLTGRRVELELMNSVNAGVWWTTTAARLPKKAAR